MIRLWVHGNLFLVAVVGVEEQLLRREAAQARHGARQALREAFDHPFNLFGRCLLAADVSPICQ